MTAEFLLGLLAEYGYWIVLVGILLDNAGLPLPGELLLLTFGALAGTDDLHLGLGVLAAAMAALTGDTIGYWVGWLGGDRVLRAYCRATLGSKQCVENAVRHYERHGKATVVFGRFVIGVRAFLAPLAGSARMPFGQFLLFDSLGALIWSGLFILVGYGLRSHVARLQHGYRAGYALLAGAFAVAILVYLLTKLYRSWRHGLASFDGAPAGQAEATEKTAGARAGASAPVMFHPAGMALAGPGEAGLRAEEASRRAMPSPSSDVTLTCPQNSATPVETPADPARFRVSAGSPRGWAP